MYVINLYYYHQLLGIHQCLPQKVVQCRSPYPLVLLPHPLILKFMLKNQISDTTDAILTFNIYPGGNIVYNITGNFKLRLGRIFEFYEASNAMKKFEVAL